MADTKTICKTLDDIIKQPDMPKIIVIGGGALGKTTLVNRMTQAEFNISHSTEDGTTDFQGASFRNKGANILFVDSPGFRLNEEKWWNGILQIKQIIGVIVMHTYEHRNSGYANFGYILAYLNQQAENKVTKFVLYHNTAIEGDNYMVRSTPFKKVDHSAIHKKVIEWIENLSLYTTIEIYSPVALIKQYHASLEKIRSFDKQMADHVENIIRLEVDIKTVQGEKQTVGNQCEELKEIIDDLPKKLASYDEKSGGYVPNAPHSINYLFSWLPFAGTWHLHSLRKKAEEDHALVIRVMDSTKKKKKKD